MSEACFLGQTLTVHLDHHQHLAHEVVILSLADCEEIFATGGARFKNQTYKAEFIPTYRKEPKKEKKPKGTPSSSTTDQQPQGLFQ